MRPTVSIALSLLSFLCLVDVRKPQALTQNIALGCQAFSMWENAQGAPRYWILHCPNEAWGAVTSDGTWSE